MTYSILGRDPVSGELGLAVQSRFFAAGRIVPWIEAGVGAIASQAFAEARYGYEGLALLKAGSEPETALNRLKEADADSALRQVAFMDKSGRIAVHTGARCVAAAGHSVGAHCVAQANMMARDTVWRAMTDAFEQSTGALADKLLAAMVAAEHEGGDIRGAQAAALIVVSAKPSAYPRLDPVVDLRIDDHADPVGEIARLLKYSRAHQRAMAAMSRLASDPAGALADVDAVLAEFPEDGEFLGRRVMALMANGRFPEAKTALTAAQEANPNAREFMLRLADAGIIPVGRDVLASMFQ